MGNEVLGRDAELERLGAFLDVRELDGPRALVLEGEAGIGKSTLWLRGLELARERGTRILSSRPAEADRGFALAGVGDLFEGALPEVLPALPPPRRRALEVALLLAEADDPLAPRTLGVAVRSALELLAEAQPLLVAVDDVQWLDGPSIDALAFALRRTAAPIQLLLARRVGSTEPPTLESAPLAASVERLHVGPLTAGALQAVLRERLDRAFPRPTLLRIHETSGGNPFYALELARALPDEVDPAGPLPVPETLDELVRARIEVVPRPARQALVLVAAAGEVDADTLRMAGAENALGTAVSHGIVESSAGRLRFTHPLLAASVYRRADAAARRAAHATLAELVRDPLERARHLALAAEGPDDQIAAALDQAAGDAGFRGVPAVAAELGELARRLTPENDRHGRHRRGIVAATAHLRAGDARRARLLADETSAEAADGRSRAEALVLMSAVEGAVGNRGRAISLRREALAEGDSHPALQAAVHQWLAGSGAESSPAGKERHARASLELAERLDDNLLRAGALAVLALNRFVAGEPDAVSLAQQAQALATAPSAENRRPRSVELAHLLAWSYERLDVMATFTLIYMFTTIGHVDSARALLDRVEPELAPRDERLTAKALCIRSALEIEAGRWSLAAAVAERERELSALYEASGWAGPLIVLSQLSIHRGELGKARELASSVGSVAHQAWDLAIVEALLALADRSAGDRAGAAAHFAAAEAVADRSAANEPSWRWWRADFCETLLELGRVDDAVELLDVWEPGARKLGRSRTVAHITRCRGLVAAARGDVDLALATLERAVDEADAETDPFGHARALLALGTMRRRARQKRGAREAIAAALAGFEALGEVPWTKRARAELGRISGRQRERGLTAAERRVAALVADGRTNREVAAVLSLGERTIETHLTHIYAKLGVRSRTELARVYEPA